MACEITGSADANVVGHVRRRDHDGVPARPPRRDRRASRATRRRSWSPGSTPPRSRRSACSPRGPPSRRPASARSAPATSTARTSRRCSPGSAPTTWCGTTGSTTTCMGQNPPAFDILYWNADTTRLPAGLHSDFLDLFVSNGLVEGTLTVLGTPVDLGKVDVDTYVVAGSTDHIVPWQTAYQTTQLLGGESRVRAQLQRPHPGHRQPARQPEGVVPHRRRRTRRPTPTSGSTAPRPHAGSWWDHWVAWLAARSGERGRRHRRQLGSDAHPPLDPAPAATSTSREPGVTGPHVRPGRRAPRPGVHPRRGPPAAAHHGPRRQHRDVGPARAGAQQPRHPDHRLRRVGHRRIAAAARPAADARPRPPGRPPARRPRPSPTPTCSACRSAVPSRRSSPSPTRTAIRRLVLASTMCGIGGVPGNPLALSLLATPLRYYSPTFLRLTANILYGPRASDDEAPPAPPDRRPPGPAADAVGIRRPARRRRRLDEPAVAAPHPHAHARAHRRRPTPIVPPINARILARRIPNAELEIVPDAGHLLLMDHAERSRPHRHASSTSDCGACRPRTSDGPASSSSRPEASDATPIRTVGSMQTTDTATRAGHLARCPTGGPPSIPTAPASTTTGSHSPTPSSSHGSRRRPSCSPRHGIGPGDVVATLLTNRVELVVVMFAAWRLGAALTPVNPSLTAGEAAFQIEDAGARRARPRRCRASTSPDVDRRSTWPPCRSAPPTFADTVGLARSVVARAAHLHERHDRQARRGSCSTTPTSPRWSR